VLKDILLVVASILLFGTIVTPLQYFGYSIALGGLVYYKLGGDKLKETGNNALNAWKNFGTRKPVAKKLVIAGAVITFIVVVGTAFGSQYAPAFDTKAYLGNSRLPGTLGGAGA
jgi:drug/metabolite transporter (DMT)-like permease